MTEVYFKLNDSSLTPTDQTLDILTADVSYAGDRDIKVFDLGTMAFLIEDILSGYKLPNYITDMGRQKEAVTIQGYLTRSVHGDDIEAQIWAMRKFLMLTALRYKNNYVEIGTDIVDDNIVTDGTEPIYCKVKTFNFKMSAEHPDYIPYSIVLWLGRIVRLVD